MKFINKKIILIILILINISMTIYAVTEINNSESLKIEKKEELSNQKKEGVNNQKIDKIEHLEKLQERTTDLMLLVIGTYTGTMLGYLVLVTFSNKNFEEKALKKMHIFDENNKIVEEDLEINKHFQQLIRIATTPIENNREDLRMHILNTLKFKEKELDELMNKFKSEKISNKKMMDLLMIKAEFLKNLNQIDKALEKYDKYIEIAIENEDKARAAYKKAYLLSVLKTENTYENKMKIIASCEESLKYNEKYGQAYFLLGSTYENLFCEEECGKENYLKNLYEASKFYEKAILNKVSNAKYNYYMNKYNIQKKEEKSYFEVIIGCDKEISKLNKISEQLEFYEIKLRIYMLEYEYQKLIDLFQKILSIKTLSESDLCYFMLAKISYLLENDLLEIDENIEQEIEFIIKYAEKNNLNEMGYLLILKSLVYKGSSKEKKELVTLGIQKAKENKADNSTLALGFYVKAKIIQEEKNPLKWYDISIFYYGKIESEESLYKAKCLYEKGKYLSAQNRTKEAKDYYSKAKTIYTNYIKKSKNNQKIQKVVEEITEEIEKKSTE